MSIIGKVPCPEIMVGEQQEVFSGHVPKELKAIYPDAKIHEMSQWGGYDSKYRSHFIEPMDSLFNIIHKIVFRRAEGNIGHKHIFGNLPFLRGGFLQCVEKFPRGSFQKKYRSLF
ncbi:hypothetical protein NXX91_23695 [Bacteroides thetaiotaomicron]|nr:hypothetical protein [Bacteroides thetaiotaomicron]